MGGCLRHENERRKLERGIKKRSSNFRRKPERGIKKGSKILPLPPCRQGLSKEGKMNDTDIKSGYVYHIKDSYFEVALDERLMRNRESGTYRPTYFCLRDDKTGLLWVVPMSNRIEKYTSIIDKDSARYGNCLKL